MDNNNVKKGRGLVIFLSILVVIFASLSVLLFTGILNGYHIDKEESSSSNGTDSKKSETKIEDKTKNDTTVVDTDASKVIYSGEILRENKDFGTVTFGGKEVAVKFDNGDGASQSLVVGDKSISIINGGVDNIAIMGDYIVVGIDQDGYRFEIYNSNLEQVDKLGNSIGILMGTKTNSSKLLINKNNFIYYQCDSDTLSLYKANIDGSSINKELITTTTGVACSAQR